MVSTMSGVSLFCQYDFLYHTGVQVWDKGGYKEENYALNLENYMLSKEREVPGFHVMEIVQEISA